MSTESVTRWRYSEITQEAIFIDNQECEFKIKLSRNDFFRLADYFSSLIQEIENLEIKTNKIKKIKYD